MDRQSAPGPAARLDGEVQFSENRRFDVDHEPSASGPAAERHRAANSDRAEPGHSVGQQLTKTDSIGRHTRGQNPTAVRQRVATPQDFARKVIRRNDPLPPVQVNHAQPPGVKQLSQDGRSTPASASA